MTVEGRARERIRTVKSARRYLRGFRLWGLGWLTVLLLGTTAPGQPAVADNAPQVEVVSPPTVERRILPETTPAGTVVLRGSRPVEPVAVQPPLQAIAAGGTPPGSPFRPEGWDPYYDTTGISHGSDTSGLDLRGDRSGLTR
jgi:hypothetical protein